MSTVAQKNVVNGNNLFYPHTYFQECEGLYIWYSFEKSVLNGQPVAVLYRGLDGVTSHKLPDNMTDQQIIEEMLGGIDEVRSHPFTTDQIAAEIDRRPNGEDGRLLFHVLVKGVLIAVYLSWNSDGHRWGVFDWRLDENGYWGKGTLVFRNTTLTV